MENGIELIRIEREEQKTKHGFTLHFEHQHKEYYEDGQHTQAALYCLDGSHKWPENWGVEFKEKIDKKSYQERLVIAGALLAAEVDYLQMKELYHLSDIANSRVPVNKA